MNHIGTLYIRLADLRWSEEGGYYLKVDPAVQKEALQIAKTILEDINTRKAISTFTVSTHILGFLPSSDDFDAIADYISICSHGNLVFQSEAPGLDTPVSPEIQELLSSLKEEKHDKQP